MAGSFSGLIESLKGEGFRFVTCRDFYQVWLTHDSARRRAGTGEKGVDRQGKGTGLLERANDFQYQARRIK